MLPGFLDCYTYTQLGYGCTVSGCRSRTCSILLNVSNAVIVLPKALYVTSTILYTSLFWKAKKAKKADNAPANIQASDEQNTRVESYHHLDINFCK